MEPKYAFITEIGVKLSWWNCSLSCGDC